MAKFVRDSKVSTNPNEYILIKKKRLKLFFEYQGKFKFTPKCSSCSLIVISDHTAHHTHEWSIFSLYAISCAVLMLILILYSVMGVMFTKREMFFLLLSPIYPSFSHCILPENISQARSLQPNFTKYCSGYLSS